MAIEYLTIQEAANYLGVSRATLWKLTKSGSITVYSDLTDKRKRLVRKDDIEKLRQPQPRSSH